MTGTPAILCCGEAVLDLVPATLEGGGAGFRPVAGGAALNTACALSRLAVPAGFLGALSTDPAGVRLWDHMAAEDVALDLAARSDAPSTVALATPRPDGTRFDLYDEQSAGRLLAETDLPADLPDSVAALVFGGISLIHPPAAGAFEALARREAGRRLVWLDLNIRPGLVTDAGSYRSRLTRMMRLADVIKVSDEDLGWLRTDIGALRHHAPAAMVIRTRGAAGAEAVLGTLHADLPAPKVAVADTVGAGDIFNAGVLAHLYHAGRLARPLAPERAVLVDALAHGIRAAAISVTRPGADAPTRKDMTCAP